MYPTKTEKKQNPKLYESITFFLGLFAKKQKHNHTRITRIPTNSISSQKLLTSSKSET
jgi:hypothetical protein